MEDPSDDFDGDGYTESEGDCDDSVSSVFPGAPERCDALDNDCDRRADDDPVDPVAWYRDADGDGFGNDALTVTGCAPGAGFVERAGDCDDASATVFPGAEETCTPFDDNCDGSLVVGADADVPRWYIDRDGDGYGSEDQSIQQCEGLPGYAPRAGDCDDRDADRRPTAWERCNDVDDDCDGLLDQEDPDSVVDRVWYLDGDGDGWGRADDSLEACDAPDGYVVDGRDCDDADPGVSPDAAEVCDGLDQDCDGAVDDGVTVDVYLDVDRDGHGNAELPLAVCPGEAPAFDRDGDGAVDDVYVRSGDDCDDVDAQVSPSAGERCNALDDDCDGVADDGTPIDGPSWARDADGDGYGAITSTRVACTAPAGFVADASDCDDLRAGVHPGAVESCRTTYDDDCDGSDNDPGALACVVYYRDRDVDGYGVDGDSVCQCAADVSVGLSAIEAGDCDDTVAATNPGAFESCGTPLVDDDCDGDVNDLDADGCDNLFYDLDGDGYGLTADSVCACEAVGYYSAADPDDCDDVTPSVNPGAREVCNTGVDDDCDGRADDSTAVDAVAWRRDADADGYGSTASPVVTDCEAPAGYVAAGGDCNDGRDNVNPGAGESCLTSYDDDCDGDDNDAGASGCVDRWTDVDDDGYGTGAASCTCADDGTLRALRAGDCDDALVAIHTDATERCDTVGVDDDCDGTADEADALGCVDYFQDLDGDGFGTLATAGRCLCAPEGAYTASDIRDCDDTDARVNPDAGNCGLVGVVGASDAAAVTSGGQAYGTDRSGRGTTSDPYQLWCAYERTAIVGTDLDGDGRSDVVIGNPGYDNGTYTNAGAVLAWWGDVRGTLALDRPADADASYTVSSSSVYMGMGVSVGRPDGGSATRLLTHGVGVGTTWLLDPRAGSTMALVDQPLPGEGWYSGRIIPDLTGDGVDDVLANVTSDDNDINLYTYGGSGYTYVSQYGTPNGYRMKHVVADVSGDGSSDLITNHLHSSLRVYFGAWEGSPDRTRDLAFSVTNLASAADAGDVDGDGYTDVLIGDRAASSYYGRTYLLLGPLTTATTLGDAATVIQGTLPVQQVGGEVAAAGDVDGDGFDDVLVGTATADVGGTLWYGPLPAGTVDVGDADALFPHAVLGVAGVGDTDADGFDDFFVGTPTSAYTAAYLYLGQPR